MYYRYIVLSLFGQCIDFWQSYREHADGQFNQNTVKGGKSEVPSTMVLALEILFVTTNTYLQMKKKKKNYSLRVLYEID